MKTITITEYASMPGRFTVTGPKKNQSRDAFDAGNAAAIAINYANSVNSSYVIVGSNKVMELIPEQIRSKK